MNDEPIQQLTIAELRVEVGNFLSYGTDPTAWDDATATEVDLIINRGYRRFLVPPVVPPSSTSHVWTFMSPTRVVTTTANVATVDLPRHFAGFNGNEMTYRPDQNTIRCINIVPEADIRALMAGGGSTTGAPYLAAYRPKQPSTVTSQVYELLLYPTPAAAYELEFPMVCGVYELSDNNPQPLGGSEHFETLTEACLAAAEKRRDDEVGIHEQAFLQALQASIARDSNVYRPATLGNLGSRRARGGYWPRAYGVTKNGVYYGS